MIHSRVLLVLSPGFPANEHDSVCMPSQQLFIKKFSAQYPNITIIVLSLHYPYTNTMYHWNGVMVVPFNGQNKKKVDKLLLWRRVWKTLRAIKRKENVIGILSFWCTECALLGHYFSKKFSLAHYCWILGQDAKKDNRFVQFIRPASHELIALSPFLADKFEENHQIRPAHMVPNGVDAEIKINVPGSRSIDILAAGSLIRLKRYDLLIGMLAELVYDFPSLKAMLIGAGPEEKTIENLIRAKGLEQHIILKGELPHHEVMDWMHQSRIFVHPSSYEGFSTVCLEALQAGAHVVSFCDPVKDKVEQWHVVSDENEMKNILQQLLDEPALSHNSIIPYTMEESAKKIGKLFGL